MAKVTSVAECYLRLYEGGGGEINMSSLPIPPGDGYQHINDAVCWLSYTLIVSAAAVFISACPVSAILYNYVFKPLIFEWLTTNIT